MFCSLSRRSLLVPTILVVDDSEVDRRLVGGLLERQGNCGVVYACDGLAALKQFETAQALFPAATRFLMIDDDEIASPDWLELMVRTAEDGTHA